jgi:hypothetical protein
MKMLNFRKIAGVAATVLLFGAGACADLEVVNPNNPDAGRALGSAGDVEALLAGSYSSWWNSQHQFKGAELALTRMSFEATAPWNNEGMVPLSTIPRNPLVNAANDPYYINQSNTWTRAYRALAAVGQGLKALQDNPELNDELDATQEGSATRALAFGRFVQGLGHAAIAALYDQGFVIDETTDIELVEPIPYNELMTVAMGYFDEALAAAATEDFTVPAAWMSVATTRDDLVRLIHAYKARYMASVPRTPDEANSVNWAQVISEVDASQAGAGPNGFSWHYDMTYAGQNWVTAAEGVATGYALLYTWNMLNYFISGMADQSGRYQKWINVPIGSRTPLLPPNDEQFLIITPDTRFAQGDDLAEQTDNPGTLWSAVTAGEFWKRPERGQWR